jgi:hypothetical protein
MKNSATFSKTTKRDLADRAGHHCSLCLALTTCSDEMGKPFPIGDAAHQAAASPGGPRYNPKQTKRERSAAANGLWLCSSCHRKIDGDKYRYSVEDLKQMKEGAEERARRMVHGQIVFEMKNQEQAAIEYYLASRSLKNELPTSGFADQGVNVPTGGMLGIQIVPHRAISERPHLSYADMVAKGVPTCQNFILGEGTDSKGVFVARRMEVSRFDRAATSQAWIGYPRLFPPEPGTENLLPGNVAGKILRHSDHDGIQLKKPIAETSPATIDIG